MPFRGKNVLTIDDAPSIRAFLRICLQAYHVTFYEAETAAEGLKLCEQVKPDLVFLDLGLPDREGLEILPHIKTLDTDSTVPAVVILSVRKEQQTKELARQLGADAYITKPFLVEELIEAVSPMLTAKIA